MGDDEKRKLREQMGRPKTTSVLPPPVGSIKTIRPSRKNPNYTIDEQLGEPVGYGRENILNQLSPRVSVRGETLFGGGSLPRFWERMGPTPYRTVPPPDLTTAAQSAPAQSAPAPAAPLRGGFESFAAAAGGKTPEGRFSTEGARRIDFGGKTVLTNQPGIPRFEPRQNSIDGQPVDMGGALARRVQKSIGGQDFTYFASSADQAQQDISAMDQAQERPTAFGRNGGEPLTVLRGREGALTSFVLGQQERGREVAGLSAERRLMRESILAKQKSAAELAGQTFTVGQGEKVVDRAGRVLAQGEKGGADKMQGVPPGVAELFTSPDTGALDEAALAEFSQFSALTGNRDALDAYGEYSAAKKAGVPLQALQYLLQNPDKRNEFKAKYGWLPK